MASWNSNPGWQGKEQKLRREKCHCTQLQNGTKSFSPRGALLILSPRGSLGVPSQSKGTKIPPPFTLTVGQLSVTNLLLRGYVRQSPGEGRGVNSAVLFLQLPCNVSKLTLSQDVRSRPLSEEGTALFRRESKELHNVRGLPFQGYTALRAKSRSPS